MDPIDYNSYDQQQADLFAGKTYAGFWWRFLAALIDGVILAVAGSILQLILTLAGIGAPKVNREVMQDLIRGGEWTITDLYGVQMWEIMVNQLASILLGWLYFALMESSSRQGTLGKMALGITVTDLEGRRISFARASGRHFAKWVSGLTILIGYIMAGFTEKKQALHDMIAGCLVMKRES